MFGDEPILVKIAILQGFLGFKILPRIAGPQLRSARRSS